MNSGVHISTQRNSQHIECINRISCETKLIKYILICCKNRMMHCCVLCKHICIMSPMFRSSNVSEYIIYMVRIFPRELWVIHLVQNNELFFFINPFLSTNIFFQPLIILEAYTQIKVIVKIPM